MKAILKLEKIINEVPNKLRGFTGELVEHRPGPHKWSKKEMLGHLIDSAFNNHQRFIRLQIDTNLDMPQYQQNEWVRLQHYQDLEWNTIINLWHDINRHIVHVLKKMDHSKLSNTANFPDYGTQTLQFIIDDYVVHIEHHLKALLS